MPEQPFVPPPRKAVGTYTSPVHVDIFYTELVNRDDPAYVQNAPVKRGTLYSQIIGGNSDVSTAYPTLYFLKEARFQQSDQLVLWTWTNDPSAQDTYNATITYALESVTSPTYTRVYTLRRDVYDAIPEIPQGSHFDRLIGVRIIDGGQDYTYATGTIDTGATVDFVVADGVIISGIVTNEGAAITDGGQITITGDGGGAEATAIIQPASAVLVAQHKEEFPDGDPLENEYVKVTQVYQTLPGPTINNTVIYADGNVVNTATTVKVASTIVSGETLNGGVWTMTTKRQAENAYIGEEVVETRAIPGDPIPSTEIDSAGDITTQTRTLSEGPPTLVTTITTAGGVYTKTFAEPLTERITFGKGASDLVSWKIVQVKLTQNTLDSYEAEIPDLLPEEFRPKVPVTTHEETLIGVATAITLPLALGVLFEKKSQIDFNTYRHTIRGRSSVSRAQIINKEITSEFGGGVVNRTLTLDLFNNLLPIDGSLTILSSNIRHIDDQVNGLAVQTTRELNAASWPILYGTHVDEKYNLIVGIQKQTLDAGTTGGVDGDGTVREVRSHDKWKSIQISSKFDSDSIPEDVQWFGSMLHSFPPELTDAIIDWAECTCSCSDSFSAVLIANVKQYTGMVKTRITEQFYFGVPPDDVIITQFFPESHHFGFAWCSFCGDSDGNCRTKSGAPEFHIPLCLHNDIDLTIGPSIDFPFAATNPAVLPHGDYIMLAPHVERWRFGVFRRVLTEVLVP